MLLILFTFLNRKAQQLIYVLFFAGALGFFLQVLYWAVIKNDFFLLFMSSLLALLCIFLAANLGNALRRD
jgi:uncharacterized membrane protein YjjP (DUF1212 family)